MAEENRGGLSAQAQAAIIAGVFGLVTVVLTQWDKMPWNHAGAPPKPAETAPTAPPKPAASNANAAPATTALAAANPGWGGYVDSPDLLAAPARLRLYARAVGRVEIDGQPRCSAFLVSETLAVSASYCVPENAGSVAVRFDASAPPVAARLIESSGAPRAGNIEDINDPSFAILLLDGEPGVQRGWLPLATAMPAPGTAVLVMGGAVRRTITTQCTVQRVNSNVFEHDCDPGEGGGGAPILDASGSRVLGLHAYGLPPSRTRKIAVRADILFARSARLQAQAPIE